MPTTEGRILSIESKTGNKSSGGTWEKIGVHLQDNRTGNEEVFFGFLPEWKRFVGKEGSWWEILWEADPKYRSQKNIKGGSQKPVPTEAALSGDDKPKMSEKDALISGQNCNNATAIVFAQVVRFGFFTAEDQIIPAWERYLKANRKMMGLDA